MGNDYKNTESYQDINSRTIDRWIEEGWEWGTPVSHEVYEKAKAGDWDVVLTPTKPVPKSWFGELRGKRVDAEILDTSLPDPRQNG